MDSGPTNLTGTVSFKLQVNDGGVAAGCEEFCEDLSIADGKLFGVVFELVGFQTDLSGGLDCRTGELRAKAENGEYGVPIPSDLTDWGQQWTVGVPIGSFNGSLNGETDAGPPPAISGTWNLADDGSGVACTGPFGVSLMQ